LRAGPGLTFFPRREARNGRTSCRNETDSNRLAQGGEGAKMDLWTDVIENDGAVMLLTDDSTVSRVLSELFETDDFPVCDFAELSDFLGRRVRGTAGALTAADWFVAVSERIYARYGIDCEFDEPLELLLARIEAAEHVCDTTYLQ
jgi:hypothetical protein